METEDTLQNRLEQQLPSVLRGYPHAYAEAVQNCRSEPSLEALLDMSEEQMAELYAALGEDFERSATPPAALIARLTRGDTQQVVAVGSAMSGATHVARASGRLVEGHPQDRRLLVVALLASVVAHAALAFGLAPLLPRPALEPAEPEVSVEVHKAPPSQAESAQATLKARAQEHPPAPSRVLQQNHIHQRGVQSKPLSRPPVSAPPSVADRLQPEYPEEAIQNDWEGTVLLDAYILPNGLVGEVRTARTSQHTVLDTAGGTALRQWHFYPARRGNKSVGAWVRLSFAFVLVDAPETKPPTENVEGQPVVLDQAEASVALSLSPVPVPLADFGSILPADLELEGFAVPEEPMCLIPI